MGTQSQYGQSEEQKKFPTPASINPAPELCAYIIHNITNTYHIKINLC